MLPVRSTALPGVLVLPLIGMALVLNSATGRDARAEDFKPWEEAYSPRVQPHDASVRALAFSPDGKWLASGSSDETICVMRSPQDPQHPCEVLRRMHGHVYSVAFLTFDRNSARLLSTGDDLHARVWQVSDGKRLWEMRAEGPVSLHPDGRIVAIGDGSETVARQGRIRLVQLSDAAVLHTLDAHEHFVTGVEFSPDGKRLVSSGVGGLVRSWSTANGELLQSAHGAGKRFSFSTDAKLLASGGPGVYLWQFPDLKLLNKWHTNPVLDLAFTADARVLAVCTTTDVQPSLSLELFRVSDGKRLQTLVREQVRTTSIAFDPQRNLLAAGMSDGSIRFFTPQNEPMPEPAPGGAP